MDILGGGMLDVILKEVYVVEVVYKMNMSLVNGFMC